MALDFSPLEKALVSLNRALSRASGKAKLHSDLDLVVMGDSPLPVRTMRQLRDDFDDSPLPFQVDIVDWATTDEEFRKIIRASAVDFINGE